MVCRGFGCSAPGNAGPNSNIKYQIAFLIIQLNLKKNSFGSTF